MIPFTDYLILKEINRIYPKFFEQMAQIADDMPSQGPTPNQMLDKKPPKEEPEEIDASEEEEEKEENDEELEDTQTDIKMMRNAVKQIKNKELKNIFTQALDKAEKSGGKSIAQMKEPPATKIPPVHPEEPPLQTGAPMQDPNVAPGIVPAQGGGGF
jgi:hypothetical protein